MPPLPALLLLLPLAALAASLPPPAGDPLAACAQDFAPCLSPYQRRALGVEAGNITVGEFVREYPAGEQRLVDIVGQSCLRFMPCVETQSNLSLAFFMPDLTYFVASAHDGLYGGGDALLRTQVILSSMAITFASISAQVANNQTAYDNLVATLRSLDPPSPYTPSMDDFSTFAACFASSALNDAIGCANITRPNTASSTTCGLNSSITAAQYPHSGQSRTDFFSLTNLNNPSLCAGRVPHALDPGYEMLGWVDCLQDSDKVVRVRYSVPPPENALPSTFQYFKLQVMAIRSVSTLQDVNVYALSEIQLLNQGRPVTIAQAQTNRSGVLTSIPQLIDGNLATDFVDGFFSPIYLSLSTQTAVDAYRLATSAGNASQADPIAFELFFLNGSVWQSLGVESNAANIPSLRSAWSANVSFAAYGGLGVPLAKQFPSQMFASGQVGHVLSAPLVNELPYFRYYALQPLSASSFGGGNCLGLGSAFFCVALSEIAFFYNGAFQSITSISLVLNNNSISLPDNDLVRYVADSNTSTALRIPLQNPNGLFQNVPITDATRLILDMGRPVYVDSYKLATSSATGENLVAWRLLGSNSPETPGSWTPLHNAVAQVDTILANSETVVAQVASGNTQAQSYAGGSYNASNALDVVPSTPNTYTRAFSLTLLTPASPTYGKPFFHLELSTGEVVMASFYRDLVAVPSCGDAASGSYGDAPSAPVYYGCFNQYERSGLWTLISSQVQGPDECARLVAPSGNSWFGLAFNSSTNSVSCFAFAVDSTPDFYSLNALASCSLCPLYGSYYCGGSPADLVVSVYSLQGATPTRYMGCFGDSSPKPSSAFTDNQNGGFTIETCAERASFHGYSYFALEYRPLSNITCVYASDAITFTQSGGTSTDCTYPCWANPLETCGGVDDEKSNGPMSAFQLLPATSPLPERVVFSIVNASMLAANVYGPDLQETESNTIMSDHVFFSPWVRPVGDLLQPATSASQYRLLFYSGEDPLATTLLFDARFPSACSGHQVFVHPTTTRYAEVWMSSLSDAMPAVRFTNGSSWASNNQVLLLGEVPCACGSFLPINSSVGVDSSLPLVCSAGAPACSSLPSSILQLGECLVTQHQANWSTPRHGLDLIWDVGNSAVKQNLCDAADRALLGLNDLYFSQAECGTIYETFAMYDAVEVQNLGINPGLIISNESSLAVLIDDATMPLGVLYNIIGDNYPVSEVIMTLKESFPIPQGWAYYDSQILTRDYNASLMRYAASVTSPESWGPVQVSFAGAMAPFALDVLFCLDYSDNSTLPSSLGPMQTDAAWFVANVLDLMAFDKLGTSWPVHRIGLILWSLGFRYFDSMSSAVAAVTRWLPGLTLVEFSSYAQACTPNLGSTIYFPWDLSAAACGSSGSGNLQLSQASQCPVDSALGPAGTYFVTILDYFACFVALAQPDITQARNFTITDGIFSPDDAQSKYVFCTNSDFPGPQRKNEWGQWASAVVTLLANASTVLSTSLNLVEFTGFPGVSPPQPYEVDSALGYLTYTSAQVGPSVDIAWKALLNSSYTARYAAVDTFNNETCSTLAAENIDGWTVDASVCQTIVTQLLGPDPECDFDHEEVMNCFYDAWFASAFASEVALSSNGSWVPWRDCSALQALASHFYTCLTVHVGPECGQALIDSCNGASGLVPPIFDFASYFPSLESLKCDALTCDELFGAAPLPNITLEQCALHQGACAGLDNMAAWAAQERFEAPELQFYAQNALVLAALDKDPSPILHVLNEECAAYLPCIDLPENISGIDASVLGAWAGDAGWFLAAFEDSANGNSTHYRAEFLANILTERSLHVGSALMASYFSGLVPLDPLQLDLMQECLVFKPQSFQACAESITTPCVDDACEVLNSCLGNTTLDYPPTSVTLWQSLNCYVSIAQPDPSVPRTNAYAWLWDNTTTSDEKQFICNRVSGPRSVRFRGKIRQGCNDKRSGGGGEGGDVRVLYGTIQQYTTTSAGHLMVDNKRIKLPPLPDSAQNCECAPPTFEYDFSDADLLAFNPWALVHKVSYVLPADYSHEMLWAELLITTRDDKTRIIRLADCEAVPTIEYESDDFCGWGQACTSNNYAGFGSTEFTLSAPTTPSPTNNPTVLSPTVTGCLNVDLGSSVALTLGNLSLIGQHEKFGESKVQYPATCLFVSGAPDFTFKFLPPVTGAYAIEVSGDFPLSILVADFISDSDCSGNGIVVHSCYEPSVVTRAPGGFAPPPSSYPPSSSPGSSPETEAPLRLYQYAIPMTQNKPVWIIIKAMYQFETGGPFSITLDITRSPTISPSTPTIASPTASPAVFGCSNEQQTIVKDFGPTLLPGEALYDGMQISNNGYTTIMQCDGNLVTYVNVVDPIWASNTCCGYSYFYAGYKHRTLITNGQLQLQLIDASGLTGTNIYSVVINSASANAFFYQNSYGFPEIYDFNSTSATFVGPLWSSRAGQPSPIGASCFSTFGLGCFSCSLASDGTRCIDDSDNAVFCISADGSTCVNAASNLATVFISSVGITQQCNNSLAFGSLFDRKDSCLGLWNSALLCASTSNCAPALSAASNATYVGCYLDCHGLELTYMGSFTQSLLSGDKVTPEACAIVAASVGMQYFGLNDGGKCSGGNSLPSAIQQGSGRGMDLECVAPCNGDASVKCGASCVNSVYQVNSGFSVPPVLNSYLGYWFTNDCYTGSAVQLVSTNYMTVEVCLAIGKAAGYQFVALGILDSSGCWGIPDDSFLTSWTPSSQSEYTCPGNEFEQCGGSCSGDFYEIFAFGSSTALPTSSPSLPTIAPTKSPGKQPSVSPTQSPEYRPTTSPTSFVSVQPTTSTPTSSPVQQACTSNPSNPTPIVFDFGSVLPPGDKLVDGTQISNNGFYTVMQCDGNLVTYNVNNIPVWASGSSFLYSETGYNHEALIYQGNLHVRYFSSLNPSVSWYLWSLPLSYSVSSLAFLYQNPYGWPQLWDFNTATAQFSLVWDPSPETVQPSGFPNCHSSFGQGCFTCVLSADGTSCVDQYDQVIFCVTQDGVTCINAASPDATGIIYGYGLTASCSNSGSPASLFAQPDSCLALWNAALLCTSQSNCEPPASTSTFLGCSLDCSDGRALPNKVIDSYGGVLTRDMCALVAGSLGFPYFGLQNGDECWAGTDEAQAFGQGMGRGIDTECTFTCAGDVDTANKCGGSCSSDVFRTYLTSLPSVPAVYLGAYQACGTQMQAVFSSDYMSLELCAAVAQLLGYSLIGLQDGNECFASNDYAAATAQLPDGYSPMPCLGNGEEICGGACVNSVYQIAPTASPVIAPTESPIFAAPSASPATVAPSSAPTDTFLVSGHILVYMAPAPAEYEGQMAVNGISQLTIGVVTVEYEYEPVIDQTFRGIISIAGPSGSFSCYPPVTRYNLSNDELGWFAFADYPNPTQAQTLHHLPVFSFNLTGVARWAALVLEYSDGTSTQADLFSADQFYLNQDRGSYSTPEYGGLCSWTPYVNQAFESNSQNYYQFRAQYQYYNLHVEDRAISTLLHIRRSGTNAPSLEQTPTAAPSIALGASPSLSLEQCMTGYSAAIKIVAARFEAFPLVARPNATVRLRAEKALSQVIGRIALPTAMIVMGNDDSEVMDSIDSILIQECTQSLPGPAWSAFEEQCEALFIRESISTPLVASPSKSPSRSPSLSPSRAPSHSPTTIWPTLSPSSIEPSLSPSSSPTSAKPSKSPSSSPVTNRPSKSPSLSPASVMPSFSPSKSPVSIQPTLSPSLSPASKRPSKSPSTSPFTSVPSKQPSKSPSTSPFISVPSKSPSASPASQPPTRSPTRSPRSAAPSSSPSTTRPSSTPTGAPWLPTKSPTLRPGSASSTFAPSQSPTARTPRYVSAVWSSTFTSVVLSFDADTNMAGYLVNQQVDCSQTKLISLVGGGDCASACVDLCYFVDSRTLVVALSPNSNFSFSGNVTIRAAGGILSRFATHASSAVSGSLQVVPSGQVPAPVVQILGPSVLGQCSDSAALKLLVQNTGGRPLTLLWQDSQGGSSTSSTYPVAYSSLLPSMVTYTVKATNWMGSSTISAPFTITYTQSTVLSVQLTAPPTLSIQSTTSLDVSALVSLPSSCAVANPTFTPQWSLVNTDSGADVSATLLKGASTLRVTTSHIPPGAYALTVNVTAVGQLNGTHPISLEALATTALTVSPAPIVVIVAAGSALSTQEGSVVSIDASASCDPNLLTPTCTSLGVLDPAARNASTVSFAWQCITAAHQPCNSSDLSCASSSCNAPVLLADKLSAANSPYTFTLTVSAALGTGAPSTLSSLLMVTVIPAPKTCLLPNVAIAPFPKRVLAQSDASALLTLSGNVSKTVSSSVLQWTDASSLLSSLVDVLVPGSAATNLNLILQTSKLGAGKSYSFRLSASVSCSSQVSFAQVTFEVNSGPVGGALQVTPLVGTAGTTLFALTASLFEDPEGDLPISFSFDALYSPLSGVYSPLSDFSLISALSVALQVGVNGNNVTVFAVARDSLGAPSGRQNAASVKVLPAATEFDPIAVLNNITSSGGSAQDLLSSIAALANAASSGSLAWRQQAQQALLLALVQSVNSTGASITPRTAAVEVSTLLALIDAAETANQSVAFITQAGALLNVLLGIAKSSVDGVVLGSFDPQATAYVPPSAGSQALRSMDSTLMQLQASLASYSAHRRSLASSGIDPNDPGSVRSTIKALVDLVMTGAVIGTPQKNLTGVSMVIAIVRESVADIGKATGVQTLVLPSFDDNHTAPTLFAFPPDVLTHAVASDSQLTDLVNLVAVRFLININELTGQGALLGAGNNYTYQPNVTEFVALEFQLTASDLLHPSNLQLPIQIITPIKYGSPLAQNLGNVTVLQANFTNATFAINETVVYRYSPACGYWNASGWSTDGCYVASVVWPTPLDDGTLTCNCNHASDYAAWQAFEADVASVLTPIQLSLVSTISLVLVCVMLPLLAVWWAVLMYWGKRRDHRDAELVHLGTFTLLTANKIRLHQKQRRFFLALRKYTKSTAALPLDYYRPRKTVVTRSRLRVLWIFLRGVYYESSLLGLATRFDPYYERMQRVSILLGVIIGNLFIACFFYQLQAASDVSTGFLLGRILLGSIVVIIPVKLVVRVLFIVTVAREGSAMDRAVHIYRVLAFRNDITPSAHDDAERADVALLQALQAFYIAKRTLLRLQRAKAAMKDKTEVTNPIVKAARKSMSMLRSSDSRANPIFAGLKLELGMDRRSRSKSGGDQLPAKDEALAVRGEFEAARPKPEDLDERIEEAEEAMTNARKALSASIASSRLAWQKTPAKSFRTERVRRQRSTVFKLAAALAEPDEPELRPIQRGQWRLGHPCVYLAWGILALYFIGCVFYMAFWVLTRSAVQAQLLNSTDPYDNGTELTNDVISQATDQILEFWLLSSGFAILFTYLVTEPLLIIVRFILLPSCLRSLGARIERYADDKASVLARLATTGNLNAQGTAPGAADIELGATALAARKKTRWERATYTALDFISELINNVVP